MPMLPLHHTLPLATVLAFTLPLATAWSGRGLQASTTPAQWAEAWLQEPVEQASGNGAVVQPLLANGALPVTRLQRAAMAGDVERVKQLLEQVYDVDNNGHIRHIRHQHSRGLSALHEAVSRGHPEVVAVFMGAGADPDDPTSRGKTPLHLAADIGSVEICNILLAAGADAALVDPDGVTALGVAVREGHGEVVKVLVDRDPDIFSDRGSGALFHDAAFHGHREILAFLIAAATEGRSFGGHYGFSIDRGNPLHAAAANGHTEIARLLLQAGASLTSENSQDQTPLDLARDQGHHDLAQILKQSIQLFDAVENGDGEQARQLLARGAAYVDARRDFVETPLHLAVLANHVDMAQLLIEAGANVNAIYLNLYRTPLMLATIEGHTDMMKLLIEAGADLDARDEGVRTALLFAIAGLEYRPSLEPARLLLQAGADPNIGSRYGTPLSQAIDHGAMEIVHLLIQAGVDVNAVVDQFDTTPLHKAAGRGDDETAVRIAEALIRAGANVNAPPNIPPTFVTGGTPLGLAAGRANVAMVRLLIAHGADVHARGRFDAPLHFAARSGNLEIAQALMEAGADLQAGNVNHEGDADNSPLHLAIYHGHGDLARLFIEAGADVQARNHAGNPPVQVAAFAGLPEVIKLLVEAGSPVNLQDQAGDTPLHDAAAQGQGEAAQALLEAGADVHATNNAGHTPLDLARHHGHASVAALLQAAAASWTALPPSALPPTELPTFLTSFLMPPGGLRRPPAGVPRLGRS